MAKHTYRIKRVHQFTRPNDQGLREPSKLKVYDNNGASADQYTAVFTGKTIEGEFVYLGMSKNPYHPQGVGMHGTSRERIDVPRYSHLGKPAKFHTLPINVKRCILHTYAELWNLDYITLRAECLSAEELQEIQNQGVFS